MVQIAQKDIGLLIWSLIVLFLEAYQWKQWTGSQINAQQMDVYVHAINT